MSIELVCTIIGTAGGVVGIIYQFFRNLKADIHDQINKQNEKFALLEDRIFWLATGKKLQDAILEEKLKRDKQ